MPDLSTCTHPRTIGICCRDCGATVARQRPRLGRLWATTTEEATVPETKTRGLCAWPDCERQARSAAHLFCTRCASRAKTLGQDSDAPGVRSGLHLSGAAATQMELEALPGEWEQRQERVAVAQRERGLRLAAETHAPPPACCGAAAALDPDATGVPLGAQPFVPVPQADDPAQEAQEVAPTDAAAAEQLTDWLLRLDHDKLVLMWGEHREGRLKTAPWVVRLLGRMLDLHNALTQRESDVADLAESLDAADATSVRRAERVAELEAELEAERYQARFTPSEVLALEQCIRQASGRESGDLLEDVRHLARQRDEAVAQVADLRAALEATQAAERAAREYLEALRVRVAQKPPAPTSEGTGRLRAASDLLATLVDEADEVEQPLLGTLAASARHQIEHVLGEVAHG